MIIVYEEIESPKEKNVFLPYPAKVLGCCNEAMVWFFRYSIDMAIKDQFLVKKEFDNKTAEIFRFCQFCGEKHRCYSNEEYVNMMRSKPLQNIELDNNTSTTT